MHTACTSRMIGLITSYLQSSHSIIWRMLPLVKPHFLLTSLSTSLLNHICIIPIFPVFTLFLMFPFSNPIMTPLFSDLTLLLNIFSLLMTLFSPSKPSTMHAKLVIVSSISFAGKIFQNPRTHGFLFLTFLPPRTNLLIIFTIVIFMPLSPTLLF